jgi:hypothetical protein
MESCNTESLRDVGSKTTHRRAQAQLFNKYQGLLNHYRNEGNKFLRLTVTGDKAGTIILQKANTRVCNGNFQHNQSKRSSKLNWQWEK